MSRIKRTARALVAFIDRCACAVPADTSDTHRAYAYQRAQWERRDTNALAYRPAPLSYPPAGFPGK